MESRKNNVKEIYFKMKKIFYPPYWTIIVGIPITIYGLVIVLTRDWNNGTAYFVYILSAYMLVTFLLNVYQMHNVIIARILNSKVVKFIKLHPQGQMFLEDIKFRGKISIYQGLFINLLFALFNLFNSWTYKSVWFGAIAVYYISLSSIRYVLMRYVKKAAKYDDRLEYYEYKAYLVCGFLMLFLNIAMSGMVIQMVWYNKGYVYPGYIIYIYALYTFYAFTISFINIIKFSRLNSPAMSASKVLSFSGALMSILFLQTAMIVQFGGEEGFRRLMNSLLGGGVCLIVFGLAIYMIVKGRRKLKLYNNNI